VEKCLESPSGDAIRIVLARERLFRKRTEIEDQAPAVQHLI